MVNTLAEVVAPLLSLMTASLLAALSYLAKKKLESIEQEIEEVNQRIKEQEKQTEKEHQVVIDWMGRINKGLRQQGIEVERPDEITESIDVGEE